ncbi:hypothetical protein U1Q18_009006, partial [Sarracenia purpurea var. burkii]
REEVGSYGANPKPPAKRPQNLPSGPHDQSTKKTGQPVAQEDGGNGVSLEVEVIREGPTIEDPKGKELAKSRLVFNEEQTIFVEGTLGREAIERAIPRKDRE